MRPLSAAIFAFTCLCSTTLAQEAVDFHRDIRPILSNKCFKCHGPAASEGGLRLDVRASALKRKAIVPGKPEASRMLERVSGPDDERMPPAEASERLTPVQVTLLKKWIAQGADYPPHWAFVRAKLPPLPAVKERNWVRNPIDHFILARLEKVGLKPSPEADRATLIRRLNLDLLGLLPSPQEVDEFVRDPRPDAHEQLVERLLASPHYGERQARHWLDLARYADSNGYTIDGKRSIWPWRDWVINAFNRDLPFDQFTIEQLAGDLLPNPTQDQLIATGFHRNTSFNEEGGTNPEQFRVERVVDRTNTTGTVWLGLSVGCAQCHNHKYDPITQKEYYQLYAFLNSCEEPKLSLPTPDLQKRMQELQTELTKARQTAAPKKKSPQELEKLLADLEKETNGGWRILYPKAVTSEAGTKLVALEDRSVLASGKVGDSDVFTIESVAPETGVLTAIRLEALTHESLPKKGPGRSGNGNFVLSQITFETDGVSHRFKKAVADHSQTGYDVNQAIQGDLKKGWAVNASDARERNVDRTAIFFLEKAHPIREGQAFVLTLRFSAMPKGYPLGRFRLAVTFATERFLALPLPAQTIVLLDRQKRTAREMEALRVALTSVPTSTARVAELQKQIKALDGQIDSTLILRETARPRVTHVQKRGNFLDLGDKVEPATFASLHPFTVQGRLSNRLDLARWLMAPDNPLTARVTVNRIWQQYFGKGLVETENDFGMQGALPTHPELLDWLALEFQNPGGRRQEAGIRDQGSGGRNQEPGTTPRDATAGQPRDLPRPWSMKHLHRMIVTSATYRQSSALRPEVTAKDPQNHLLARQHRLRLEAEIIRDVALTASGLLSRKLGGPGVYPPQPPEIFAFTQNKHPWPESKGPDRYRRGMYTFIWRQSQHPLLTTFDGTDAQAACTRRNRSNTPLQALHLANDPTFIEMAKGLGERVQKEGPKDDAGRVDYAFRLCFSRHPGSAERERLLQFLQQQRQVSPGETWTLLARVLLNLDEFITRE